MCGIMSVIYKNSGTYNIARTMHKIESRGGHAWGYAWLDPNNDMIHHKEEGTSNKYNNISFTGNIAIGHTRFATSGSAKENKNNHPHVGGGFAIVHNGIIRSRHQHQLTECDSEAILKFILSQEGGHNDVWKTMKKIKKAVQELEGSFRIAIINKMTPEWVYIVTDSGERPWIEFEKDLITVASESKHLNRKNPIFQFEGETITAISTGHEIAKTGFKKKETPIIRHTGMATPYHFHYSSDDWRDYQIKVREEVKEEKKKEEEIEKVYRNEVCRQCNQDNPTSSSKCKTCMFGPESVEQ